MSSDAQASSLRRRAGRAGSPQHAAGERWSRHDLSSDSETSHAPLLESVPRQATLPPRPARNDSSLGHLLDPKRQLHVLAIDRLNKLGHSMKLDDRLKRLQTGQCLHQISHALPDRQTLDSLTPDSDDDYCQERFNIFLDFETVAVDTPVGRPVPSCTCGFPCVLRQHLDTDYDGACLWVCSRGACKHWTLLSLDGGQILEAHDLHTYSTNQDSGIPTIQGKLGSFDYSDTHSVGVLHTGIAQGEQQLGRGKRMQLVTDGKVDEFWILLAGLAVDVDDDVQNVFEQKFIMPMCGCKPTPKPSRAMICRTTGDLFFTCQDKTCFFLLPCEEELPQIGKMDLGQHIKFGDSYLDRYTTLQCAMRWFGYTFSERWWKLLSKQHPSSDFLDGSKQMEANEEYSGFLSYRGASGRLSIFVSLCGQFS